MFKRREMMKWSLMAPLGSLGAQETGAASLIASIQKEVVLKGRDGAGPNWFHPRACLLPDGRVFMTLQTIEGSDYFGPVHHLLSSDLGKTWTQPSPVPPLGRVKQPDGSEEGVCDVVPDWQGKTGSVLALGHNVFYSGPKFSKDQPPRWPVYAVWKDGQWGPRQKLEWNDPRGADIYTNNCGQRVTLPNGDVVMSFTFGVKDQPRAVCGVISEFDGANLQVRQVGPALEHPHGRGLLEPSVTRFQDRYYLTLRAEDERGYVSVSDDGLNYAKHEPWQWEDGEHLEMSTTQQHWLTHSDALFLVYTRLDATNRNVVRWRSPLWLAQVDPQTLRLKRDTERVVLPLMGDGVNDPGNVALMGNFHVTHVSPGESWITVGEWHPKNLKRGGDVLLARLRWSKPNLLAG
jgi:hypothetical protein